MANKKKILGDAGETLVADYLEKQGYQILCRNFRSRFGEIDIVAENGTILAFVEVKARQTGALVKSCESVGSVKRRKILRTACVYLMKFPTEFQPRFDVACVDILPSGKLVLADYLENAFEAEE